MLTRMMRILTLCATLALSLLPATAKPNFLFLLADDQRPDTIAALGSPSALTPVLDTLARRGTAFSKAYCMGANQGAVCVPSRAMLLSGRPLPEADETLKDKTWPELFSDHGYRTFITGKWHNGAPSLRRAFNSGRSIFLGGMTDPDSAKVVDFLPDNKLSPPHKVSQHCVAQFASEAADFLKSSDASSPWLCYVAFNAPHDPRKAPPEWHAKFPPSSIPVPDNFLPEHPFDNGELKVRDELLAPHPRTPADVQRHLADYHAAIAFMDHQIGRILDAIPENQRASTFIIFTADSGLAIGSHGLFGKQNLYEHSMRVPLIIAGPGVAANRSTPALVYLHDLFPTMAALAELPSLDRSRGLNLTPVLLENQNVARKHITTSYRHLQRAVTDGRWKCIDYPLISRTQLFDLSSDPSEIHDLSSNPTHATTLTSLRTLLPDISHSAQRKKSP